jgi:hypothetical protein
MHPCSRDAVRRALATAGITGATLALASVAALPALAAGSGQGGSGHSQGQAQGQNGSPGNSQAAHDAHGNNGRGNGQGNGNGHNPQGGPNSDGHNPPGNNGTVFIHQTADDPHPGNQPHVTCGFYVALFGFDKGQQLTASFTGQAPTGAGIALPVVNGPTTTTFSPDDAGGAGNDYDGVLGEFTATNLDVANKLGAPAKQGWHIRLSVDTGQGTKTKVFWLAPCASGAPVTPTTTLPSNESVAPVVSGTAVAPTTTTVETATSHPVAARVLGEKITRAATPATPARVLGMSVSRHTNASRLPFTGAEIGLMALGAAAALGGGTVLVTAARRRRESPRP